MVYFIVTIFLVKRKSILIKKLFNYSIGQKCRDFIDKNIMIPINPEKKISITPAISEMKIIVMESRSVISRD
jgi:hypothetical protein